MSSFIKYNCFVRDLAGKVHDLLGTTPGTDCDRLRIGLSNTSGDVAPTKETFATCTEIASGNGYTSGGLPTSGGLNSGTASGGTFTLTGTKQTWTATGGSIGPFRYVILYNFTVANGPLIGAWDYGSSITLNAGETFTVLFNGGDPTGTILTIT